MVSDSWDSFKEKHKHWKRNTWIGLMGGILVSLAYNQFYGSVHEGIIEMATFSLIAIVVSWGATIMALRVRQKYYGTPDWGRARAVAAFLAALIILMFIAIFLRIL